MSRIASITKAASNEKRDIREEMAYIGTINMMRITILMQIKVSITHSMVTSTLRTPEGRTVYAIPAFTHSEKVNGSPNTIWRRNVDYHRCSSSCVSLFRPHSQHNMDKSTLTVVR